jgi:sugar phosphate isomerase/epimerase
MNRSFVSMLVVASLAFAPTPQANSEDGRSKIAVMETAFQKRADASSLADARQAGYSAIQMHSGMPQGFRKKPLDRSAGLAIGLDPTIVQSWRGASEQYRVEIISLCAGCLNKCRIWDRDREAAMRVARQTIDACHDLDVSIMLFPFFGPSNFQSSDEALQGTADFMRELLPYAKAKDVVIGIEAPVTTVRVLELLKLLEFPENLKIYYDTGNLFEKEDIYETIREHGQQHFCEIHIKPAGAAVVGEGKIDLKQLAKALDDADYDKWLVYEANREGKQPVANRRGIERIVSLRE